MMSGMDTVATCSKTPGAIAALTVLIAVRFLPHLVVIVLLVIAALSCCPYQTCRVTHHRQRWLAEALQTGCWPLLSATALTSQPSQRWLSSSCFQPSAALQACSSSVCPVSLGSVLRSAAVPARPAEGRLASGGSWLAPLTGCPCQTLQQSRAQPLWAHCSRCGCMHCGSLVLSAAATKDLLQAASSVACSHPSCNSSMYLSLLAG